MLKLLEEQFNRGPLLEKCHAILEDFPKPACDVVQAPRLDNEVRDQQLKKGMDPKHGLEKTLFKLQEQFLEITGPSKCFWHNFPQPDARPSNAQMIHLLQRALVLVGGTSQTINVERRQITWSRVTLS